MPRRGAAFVAVLAAMTLAAAACSSPKPAATEPPVVVVQSSPAGTGQSKYFVQADFDRQMAQRRIAPQGDPATPWLQMIQPTMVDTSKYAKPGAKWHVCFSNASTSNPWRVTGLTTMKAEAKLHPEIGQLTVVDAQDKDDKQIADLAELQTKKCDVLIVSPSTTTGLTPAVEQACQSGVPVVVFDRGVTTDCPVSFVHPIGGYAFGAASAEFNNVDLAKAKTIVKDYVQRFGKLDGVWLDAGFASVAVAEAFKEIGKPVPALTGEDQQDFLALWQKTKLTAIAPTYPVYQWRTALIAATYILSGKQVPKEWILPQPVITADTLSKYLTPGMPPLFFPTCGCQKMPGFPRDWGGK